MPSTAVSSLSRLPLSLSFVMHSNLGHAAQRAHANFTENLTPFVVSLLVAGLRFPVAAAGIGAAWSASRMLYAYGYAGKGPKGRGM